MVIGSPSGKVPKGYRRKTHNMIALGLLAWNPELRLKILGAKSPGATLGNVRVLGFTGRESDAPLGIWGSIAEQLGKKR